MKKIEGHCLCQKTVLSVARIGTEVTACHCKMCRKQNAGPALFTEGISADHLQINQLETVSSYSSSEWAERVFCNQCGTFLFYRHHEEEKLYLNVDLFNDSANEYVFNQEIFYDSKPDYYDFANLTHKKDEV